MKLNIKDTRDIIMRTFVDNTEDKDFYDVDMFISDVKCNIQNAYTDSNGKLDITDAADAADAADAKYAFECAVIDAIREIDIYDHYGSEGCVIIVAELFDFAKKFFDEAN